METKYFPKGVIIKTLEAAQEEAVRQDMKFVYGLEAAIHILKNAEPLDFTEAMSRMTPKKPELKFHGEFFICPSCEHPVEDFYTGGKFNYCPACGQAIDWNA